MESITSRNRIATKTSASYRMNEIPGILDPFWRISTRVFVLALLWVVGIALGLEPPAKAQASVVGQWSPVQTWPVVSVHTQLVATGKILFWDYSGNSYLWDPATAVITQPAQPGRNLFCAGNSTLADGKVFVPGGHIANNVGLASASYYDPVTNTWTSVPDMNAGRWYPSSTTLANGDVLVTSGDIDVGVNNTIPQVFQVATSTWRDLTSASLAMTLYPRTFLAPNGKVFFATGTSRYLDTTGTGAWTTVGAKINAGTDNYGSAAIYDTGKVIFVGGADPPTASCEIIDLNAPTPAWTATGSMAQPRRQNNITLLPDGKVLVTGGSFGAGFNDSTSPVLTAEVWDPATGQWNTLASATQYRGYHSCATLLPDGRVLSSGGDGSSNAEVFSPPYLFSGPRPTISSAPATVTLGSTFFVGTPDALGITKVTWTRLGNLTHAQNWNQRINLLSYTQASGGLNVTVPSSANVTPPGHYLLWILNGSGVPSVAAIVKVILSTTPDFSLSASPSSQTVTAGASTSYTTTVTPSGGFTGTVTFSASGLPSGASASFNPASVTTSGSSTMTVNTSATTPAGSYVLTITGTSGTLVRTTTVTLVVQSAGGGDFSLSATPTSSTVDPGTSTSYTITVTPSGGFTGNVVFGVNGLPAYLSANFSPSSVTGSGSSTLTVSADGTAPEGTVTLTISGTSAGITRTTTVTLTITGG